MNQNLQPNSFIYEVHLNNYNINIILFSYYLDDIFIILKPNDTTTF